MNEASLKRSGVLRRALFVDVPFILDSLWRWSEFRSNRLGIVETQGDHSYVLRRTWRCSAVFFYLLICLFAIFGPSSDRLCGLVDYSSTYALSRFAGVALFVLACILFVRVLNSVAHHLARRAEVLATSGAFATASGRSADSARSITSLLGRLSEKNFGNLRRLLEALPLIDRGEGRALFFALLVLAAGILVFLIPIGLTAEFLYYAYDNEVCQYVSAPGNVIAQIAMLMALVVGGAWLWRKLGESRPYLACLALTLLLAAVIVVLWMWFTPPMPSEAAGGFYPHVYLAFVGALMLVALLARLVARVLFSGFAPVQPYRDALAKEDLLRPISMPGDISTLPFLWALMNGITAKALYFLLLPSFVVIMAPAPILFWMLPLFTAVSSVLIVCANVSSRWDQMLIHVRRWFLTGTPLVMSTFIVVVAALRLFKVPFVSSVLTAAPMGLIFSTIVMIYAALWFFEYWVNRWLGEELLRVLGASPTSPMFVRHALHDRHAVPWANARDRVIALHGIGRLVAQGWFEFRGFERRREQAFNTYSFLEFIDVLMSRQEGGEGYSNKIRRRVMLYFTQVNLMLFTALVGMVAWQQNWSRPLAEASMVNASAIKPDEISDAELQVQARQSGDRLASRLLAQAAEQRPSIVVAASGGGSYAAVYTALGLEGLAKINRARDVVLLSGVSGGGVSAAVFASRFESLRLASPAGEQPGPWKKYVAQVGQPFFKDVLEGAGELRIAGSASLSVLLEESLDHNAFAPHMTNIETFGQLKHLGLILNTSISGHPYSDSEVLSGRVAAPGMSCVSQSAPYANLAGGRLIFTNLDNISGFPEPSMNAPDLWLPYRVVNDGNVTLATASTLTANAAPLFANARVRLITREHSTCPAQSYFVTDGSATDNLGLISALYALRGTLRQLPENAAISDIHVIALEASALDYTYSGDRDTAAVSSGAKERNNAGLTQQLLAEVGELSGLHGAKLRVHYLPMPFLFRARRGYGTHWVFPREIGVRNPLVRSVPGWSQMDYVVLDGREVLTSWRALFDPRQPACALAQNYRKDPLSATADWTPNVQTVTRWICGHDDYRAAPPLIPDYHVEAWGAVVRELGSR